MLLNTYNSSPPTFAIPLTIVTALSDSSTEVFLLKVRCTQVLPSMLTPKTDGVGRPRKLSTFLSKLKFKFAHTPVNKLMREPYCRPALLNDEKRPLIQPTMFHPDHVCTKKARLPIPISPKHHSAPTKSTAIKGKYATSRLNVLPATVMRRIIELLDEQVLIDFDRMNNWYFVRHGPSNIRFFIPLFVMYEQLFGESVGDPEVIAANESTSVMLFLLQKRVMPDFKLGEVEKQFQGCKSDGRGVRRSFCNSSEFQAIVPKVRWYHTTKMTCSYCGSREHACQRIMCSCWWMSLGLSSNVY